MKSDAPAVKLKRHFAPQKAMTNLDVTIAVVPRERFSHTAPTLESIYALTPLPLRLVYVDGGSPARIARYLRNQAHARGFTLVRTDHYLSPNEARNLALAQVKTKYVVFIDNDVLVSPGWLDALVECAEETGAWIVGPLILAGRPGFERIHCAGGASRVEELEGRRLFFEEHYFAGKHLNNVGPLQRAACEMAEFHCMLVRVEAFERLGELDEQLLSTHEHNDLCMAIKNAGRDVYCEPSAVVTYVTVPPIALLDLPYYLFRWSEEWNDASVKRFRAKWELNADDPATLVTRTWATDHRQSLLWPLRPYVDRLTRGRSYGIERRLFAPLETRLSNYFTRRARRMRTTSTSFVA